MSQDGGEDSVCEVVITAPDPVWAAEHVRSLVGARLAACGHQFPIHSIYRWDGAVQDDFETRIALHTQTRHLEAITAATIAAHPYEVPCIIAQPLSYASPDYRAWIIDSTTKLTTIA